MFHRDQPDRCLQMKRTKQKGSGSPQLRPSPRSGGRPGSVPSSPLMSPESSPSVYALEPATLSQSAPTVMTTSVMGRQVFRWFVVVFCILNPNRINCWLQTCAPRQYGTEASSFSQHVSSSTTRGQWSCTPNRFGNSQGGGGTCSCTHDNDGHDSRTENAGAGRPCRS